MDAIRMVPKHGGMVTTACSAPGVHHLTLDQTNFYFTSTLNQVFQVGRKDSFTTILATNQKNPTGIALSATHVYWLNSSDTNSVMHSPINVSSVIPVANVPNGSLGGELASDDKALYVGTLSAGEILQIPLYGGGNPITIVNVSGSVYGLAVDATSIYWNVYPPSAPYAVAKADKVGSRRRRGPNPTTLVPSSDGVLGFALDSTNLYWSSADQSIKCMPIGGGNPKTVASGYDDVAHLTVDDECIYFTSKDTVQVVAKP